MTVDHYFYQTLASKKIKTVNRKNKRCITKVFITGFRYARKGPFCNVLFNKSNSGLYIYIEFTN